MLINLNNCLNNGLWSISLFVYNVIAVDYGLINYNLTIYN